MAKYEITIYNAKVREKVEAGERHPRFGDDWADFRYLDIRAESESEARARVEARYPPQDGFVIDNVIKSQEQEYE